MVIQSWWVNFLRFWVTWVMRVTWVLSTKLGPSLGRGSGNLYGKNLGKSQKNPIRNFEITLLNRYLCEKSGITVCDSFIELNFPSNYEFEKLPAFCVQRYPLKSISFGIFGRITKIGRSLSRPNLYCTCSIGLNFMQEISYGAKYLSQAGGHYIRPQLPGLERLLMGLCWIKE